MKKWLLTFILIIPPLFATQIFWEGENAVTHTFNMQGFPPVSFGEKKDELSQESWLYHNGKQAPTARYSIDVPQKGDYHLYARLFWHHGPFHWRFDNETWQACDQRVGVIDWTLLAPHVCANWKYLGKVSLDQGRHPFEVRVDETSSDKKIVSAFDGFLLTDEVVIPYGKYFDGLSRAMESTFPYAPPQDPFDEALLDLRSLNEKLAGEAGYIRRKDDKLYLGDGHEVKLWGVNITTEILHQSNPLLDYLAKRLAKVGVNAVRCHCPLFSDHKIDRQLLDRLHYLVATMKSQGIYTALSFFYPLWIEPNPHALIFFDKETQALWQKWTQEILSTPNPYTSIPLSQEGALAIVEILNEDSLFFWTFNEKGIPPAKMEAFEKIYGDYLTQKFGSLKKARTAWPFAHHHRDDIENNRMGLYNAGELTDNAYNAANGHKRRRIAEQRQFFLEVQKAFYAQARQFLHDEIGYDGLVVASNWITADPATLDSLERDSYREGDLIDNHAYFVPGGSSLPYAVSLGDTVENRSAILEPKALPLPTTFVDGFPHITSEIGWTNPNRFLAEGPFLMSASPRLNGLFWFCVNRLGTSEGINKFPVSTPSIQGQFPAYALQFRRYGATFEVKDKLALVNTPFSQGAAGFLREGALSFGDCAFESDNEYGAVCLISLDGRPLATSKKMLVQAFTEENPYQFTITDGKITDLGRAPLNVKNIECRLTIKGGAPSRVTALDFNGYFKEELPTQQTITLPKDTLYTLIERSSP